MSQPGVADPRSGPAVEFATLARGGEQAVFSERTAADPATGPRRATDRPRMDAAEFFLPDFCEPRKVLAVVLIGALLSVMLALAGASQSTFLNELARVSVFVQWIGLTSAGLICMCRPRLEPLGTAAVSVTVCALLIGNVALLSVLAVGAGYWLDAQGFGAGLFPESLGPFVLRNIGIALIAGALVLRYYFVSHQWRRHVRAEASARIDALHARIRPHFLFNSLNTIASLIGTDSTRAEEAVEDLADLFRATLRDSGAMITFAEELELARVYQRIEQARLGDRLSVTWHVDAVPDTLRVPTLMLQPLLENAINHGIEPRADGGAVAIDSVIDGDLVRLTVSNPLPTEGSASVRAGNRLALDNIRDRLALAYDGRASLAITASAETYEVELSLPLAV